MLRQTSLGSLGLVIGGLLTIVGIIAYATGNATLNLAGFFYGIPLLLGGLALKITELKPVPFSQPTSPDIVKLREEQSTSIQKQIRKDVTRYRYGQDAHLDESLKRLGLSPIDEERPILTGLRETEIDKAYTLVMEFDSPFISLEEWHKKKEKLEKFFGPGIRAEIIQLEEDQIEVALISLSDS